MRTIKTAAIAGFVCALAGLFAFGNYLMIDGHRPSVENVSKGFIYPMPGKGAAIYISAGDLMLMICLIGLLVVSMLAANWAHKKIG